MKIRIALARFAIRLGEFIKSLPIMIMKPDGKDGLQSAILSETALLYIA